MPDPAFSIYIMASLHWMSESKTKHVSHYSHSVYIRPFASKLANPASPMKAGSHLLLMHVLCSFCLPTLPFRKGGREGAGTRGGIRSDCVTSAVHEKWMALEMPPLAVQLTCPLQT